MLALPPNGDLRRVRWREGHDGSREGEYKTARRRACPKHVEGIPIPAAPEGGGAFAFGPHAYICYNNLAHPPPISPGLALKPAQAVFCRRFHTKRTFFSHLPLVIHISQSSLFKVEHKQDYIYGQNLFQYVSVWEPTSDEEPSLIKRMK